MVNGSTTLLPLAPETSRAPVQPPIQDEPEVRIEPALLQKIGELTADGVILLAGAMQEYGADGVMAACTREQGGVLIVQLYQLQQTP